MSKLTQAIAALAGQSTGGFYPTEIAQSLRFNDDDSAYLSRTPSVAGNRKTWTFSAWVKRGNLGSGQSLFQADISGSSNTDALRFDSDNVLTFYLNDTNTAYLRTSQVFRDSSAWYHIVLSVDTTQATASNRFKFYVNGEQVTSFATSNYPAQNTDCSFNSTQTHCIGRNNTTLSQYLDGYLAEVHFTDGTAYTADAFGEFKSGVWVAKTPSVTYGTNGFYLPFEGKASLAEDSWGNYDGTNSGATIQYDAGYGDNVVNIETADTIATSFPLITPNSSSMQSYTGWIKVPASGSHSLCGSNASSIGHFHLGLFIEPAQVSFREARYGGGAEDPVYTASYSSYGLSISAGDWVHVALVKTAANYYSIYINGTVVGSNIYRIAETSTSLYFGQYYNNAMNASICADVIIYNKTLTSDEVTALASGEEVTTGIAARYPFNTDKNGFLDSSGNNNTWAATNLQTTDVMLDSPTNNFATWNPLSKGTSTTLSEGNLKYYSSAASNTIAYTTMAMSSSSWYMEFAVTDATVNFIGIWPSSNTPNTGYYPGRSGSSSYGWRSDDGNKYNNGTASAYSSAWGTIGNVVALAYDADAGTLTGYINGVSQGTMFSGLSGEYVFAVGNNASTSVEGIANFGQDSSFAGTKTPQGNTDANGLGDFYYEPPTDYLALCTANLPEPAISPADRKSPSDYFNTVLYTGNGSTQSIDVGFAADLVWHKVRSQAYAHGLYDSVRGATLKLSSNSTNAEATDTSGLTAFDTNGFDIGSDAGINQSGDTYVAWNWKANGTGVSNTDGTITSTVSANTDAGFSIVSWTGTATAGTIGHGLTSAPEFIITKRRNYTTAWHCYSETLGNTNGLYLNDTAASTAFGPTWNSTSPTSSVFSVGSGDWINQGTMIAYCFHSVEGFSKFGSYTGNGSTDGPFVYTGFRPAFVLVKSSSLAGSYWHIMDAKRNEYNVADKLLYPNVADAEGTGLQKDFLSNGFKIRSTATWANGSGQTYIYMAFAENPFKYATAR